jgi:hypothetical protein
MQPQLMLQDIFTYSVRVIGFVSKNEERDAANFFHGEERLKQIACLRKPLLVFSINNEDDPINVRKI